MSATMPWPRLPHTVPLAEMVRFGLVGVLTNVVYFGALGVLTFTTALPLWLAGGLSYALSMVVNYLVQRRATFRSERAHVKAGPRYLVVQLIGLCLNSLLLDVLVTRLGVHLLAGLAVALAVVMLWSYLAQKLWVFRRHPITMTHADP
jgi:putative flippase GtrA